MQDDDFFNQRHKINAFDVEDQIFREIMQHHHHHQPAFSSESDSHSPTNQSKCVFGLFFYSKQLIINFLK